MTENQARPANCYWVVVLPSQVPALLVILCNVIGICIDVNGVQIIFSIVLQVVLNIFLDILKNENGIVKGGNGSNITQ